MRIYTEQDVFGEQENIAISHKNDRNEPKHKHDFVEMVCIVGGKGVQSLDGKEYPVSRGDLLFINYGQTHAFEASKNLEYYNIYLKPEFISGELINSNNAFSLLSLTAFEDFRESVEDSKPLVRFVGTDMEDLEAVLHAMYREHRRNCSGKETVMKSFLTVLLSYVFRKMSVSEENVESKEQSLQDMITYIEENCAQKLSLASLAERCFYNPSYFCRVFKEYSGKTLTDFIRESRIKKSCELLSHTKLSVEEICCHAGFTNKTLFYKQFREQIGVSPAEYRKSKNVILK